jgi:hypothetical protein
MSSVSKPDLDRRRAESEGEASILSVGGVALALGSLGITATSALYALSPPAAALPAQPFDQAMALAGAVVGARTMFAAGTVGILSDVVAAVGAMLIVVELVCREKAAAAAGWAAIFLSIVVFTFVDAMVGYVLSPVAAMPDGASAFTAFKRLFDVLFLLGTMAFGGGAILALTSEMRSPRRIVNRGLAVAGSLVGSAGVLASAACLAGLPLQQGVGISIGLGSAIFIVIGVQVARAEPSLCQRAGVAEPAS